MKRGILTLAAIFVANLALSGIVLAAPKSKPPRIGFLALEERHCRNAAFLDGLRDLGYVDGKNIVLECHHGGGQDEQMPAVAQKLAHSRPAVIVALNHAWVQVAHQATKDIPIVAISSGDPVASGFAKSLARPGGNVTGLTYFALELNAKKVELLRGVVPTLKRLAVIQNPKSPRVLLDAYQRETRAAARQYGIEVLIVEATNPAELERAFGEIVQNGAQAVFVFATQIFGDMMQEIADLAAWNKLPTMHFHKRYPAIGGLMAYAPDYDLLHRRAATYVDKILKGAKPGDLPFQQPERFEFSINRATARDLGLTIPDSLLLRADKVIE